MSGSAFRKLFVAGVIAAGVSGVVASHDSPIEDVWNTWNVSSMDDIGEEFTACMRAHGLPGFPDVALSSDGAINLYVGGKRVDALSDKYGEAVKACEPRLPGSQLPHPPAPPVPPVRPVPPLPR